MNASTVQFAVDVIGDRVGVATHGRLARDPNGDYYELVASDFHPNEGFAVQLRLGWRTAETVLIPGRYAGQLITRMGQADGEGRLTFAAFAAAIAQRKGKVTMRVNNTDITASDPASWPASWSNLELGLKLTPVVIEPDNAAQHERLVLDLLVPLFGMVVALIGTEERELPTSGEMEGRALQTLSTRYERKRINREACIQLKGTRCTVCGFDFAETYGPLGSGYIEVHHLRSIASLGGDYRIDVSADLAPICANCHAMAHREQPAVPLERLKALVEDRRHAKEIGAE
ncbi:MAG TPA: HNH endonuclease [Chthoniobacterales bacterium]|nr:HNH endonuclease [Chthoniobacterales bacterium]